MPTPRRLSALALPAATAVILMLLALLATLQYRWAGELSAAEIERLRAGAKSRAEALARDFDLEVTRAFVGLQMGGDALVRGDFGAYADRYEAWRRTAAYPGLVHDVLLVEPSGSATRVARYEPARGAFDAAEWTPALEPVRRRIADMERGPFGPMRPGGRPGGGNRPLGPILEDVPALLLFGDGPGAGPRRPPDGSPGPGRGPSRPLLVVVLDPDAIRDQILPALAQRHFAGPDGPEYDLAVVKQGDRRHVVWQSRADAPRAGAADAAAGLLDLRFEEVAGSEGRRFPGIRAHTEDTGAWRLLAFHRAGSLGQVVAAARRRNLAVGFGILVLVGASVALIAASSQRARRLAERQMEFVAAVSHELRTPVAAICSSSENLADGVVTEPSQVRAYGAAIRDEGRRLGDMLERVLEFAGAIRSRGPAPAEDVAVSALVDDALRPFAPQLEARGFTVVREIAPDLPPLRGDSFALRRALQNLVENALKYDEGGRWLAVRAGLDENGRGIRISIEDHGEGIAPSELAHVFEPFFRGRQARAAQVRGFGLGLALARRLVEDHGGRLRVDSAPGRGTAFTIHLPAVSSAAPKTVVPSDALTNPDR